MSKKFTATLSVSSIRKLQNDLKKYKNDFSKKTEIFVEELAKAGIEVAQAKVNASPLGKYINLSIETKHEPNIKKAILVGVGEVKTSSKYPDFNTLLAVEFGAGITFNPIENPKASELGYGVGTFPGQLHAFDENGWYFWDEEKQKWIHSYGIKATMPMYNASVEMLEKIEEILKEVF